ncbi:MULTISPECIES: hypothetical protein [unclassified Streptomyces]|uniref:hypothetical protein n=1 Tax=unclassified Streptomyces TaxID=2593676 RepID=UPI0022557A13|nr:MULTISPECIES: hypothetical protein [unclassified Streptomyces]MCX4405969.1 hypothetical protein [Streptomyces sp. NBC_01764]MCX5189507.1 hypothetical protein [Streptomyces sp. NBC_00268]
MTFEITDSKGRSRKFLDWPIAAAFAVGKVKVTAEDGTTVEVDPARIGGTQ